jgi:hypothetical protein
MDCNLQNIVLQYQHALTKFAQTENNHHVPTYLCRTLIIVWNTLTGALDSIQARTHRHFDDDLDQRGQSETNSQY